MKFSQMTLGSNNSGMGGILILLAFVRGFLYIRVVSLEEKTGMF